MEKTPRSTEAQDNTQPPATRGDRAPEMRQVKTEMSYKWTPR